MNKVMHNLLVVFIAGFALSGCGLFGDGASGAASADSAIISEDVIAFDVSDGATQYHSVAFANNTSEPMTVTNILFGNNNCSAFALYNVTDGLQNVIVNSTDSLNFSLASGETVFINIAYCPPSCLYSNYQTNLYVYYERNGATERESIVLSPTPGGAICRDVLICLNDPFAYNYEPKIVEEGLPEVGQYYFRVEKMRAYLYPVSSTTNAKIIGTDLNVDPTAFLKPYLNVSLDSINEGGGSGVATLNPIGACDQFIIPSADDDSYFAGADTRVTTGSSYTSTLYEDGSVNVENVVLTLTTNRIDDSTLGSPSPLPNEKGNFQVSLNVNLTTGTTEEDTYLGSILKNTSYTNGLLNVIDSNSNGKYELIGSPISRENGSLTLVGVGEFTNEDKTFAGQDTVKKILLDNEAYIYVQIEATLMTRGAEIQ